jgi:hypothetical protein
MLSDGCEKYNVGAKSTRTPPFLTNVHFMAGRTANLFAVFNKPHVAHRIYGLWEKARGKKWAAIERET